MAHGGSGPFPGAYRRHTTRPLSAMPPAGKGSSTTGVVAMPANSCGSQPSAERQRLSATPRRRSPQSPAPGGTVPTVRLCHFTRSAAIPWGEAVPLVGRSAVTHAPLLVAGRSRPASPNDRATAAAHSISAAAAALAAAVPAAAAAAAASLNAAAEQQPPAAAAVGHHQPRHSSVPASDRASAQGFRCPKSHASRHYGSRGVHAGGVALIEPAAAPATPRSTARATIAMHPSTGAAARVFRCAVTPSAPEALRPQRQASASRRAAHSAGRPPRGSVPRTSVTVAAHGTSNGTAGGGHGSGTSTPRTMAGGSVPVPVHTPRGVHASPVGRARAPLSTNGHVAGDHAVIFKVRHRPATPEPQRAVDRPTVVRPATAGAASGTDPRQTALMRRLNESASWLSDVSDGSADEELSTTKPPELQAQQDGRSMCLAEMLNESATWIDCDVSESDREEEAVKDAFAERYPGHPVANFAGMTVRAHAGPGVARSFSC